MRRIKQIPCLQDTLMALAPRLERWRAELVAEASGRVLRPGGQLRMLEHIQARPPFRARVLNAVQPGWQPIDVEISVQKSFPMSTISHTDLCRPLASAMDQANEDHAPLYITRQKGKGAVLLSADDYASIEETLYLMSSPRNAARLTEAIEGLRQGEGEARDLIE
jgi:antitoxin YefM